MPRKAATRRAATRSAVHLLPKMRPTGAPLREGRLSMTARVTPVIGYDNHVQKILYSVYSPDAERCWGACMLEMCLWISIGAACGGALVGGLVVLLVARLP
jgi:hypothetical protein